jgi:hypothetical protein
MVSLPPPPTMKSSPGVPFTTSFAGVPDTVGVSPPQVGGDPAWAETVRPTVMLTVKSTKALRISSPLSLGEATYT